MRTKVHIKCETWFAHYFAIPQVNSILSCTPTVQTEHLGLQNSKKMLQSVHPRCWLDWGDNKKDYWKWQTCAGKVREGHHRPCRLPHVLFNSARYGERSDDEMECICCEAWPTRSAPGCSLPCSVANVDWCEMIMGVAWGYLPCGATCGIYHCSERQILHVLWLRSAKWIES
jgi:hypothetical protein